jgi:hypothetical protein
MRHTKPAVDRRELEETSVFGIGRGSSRRVVIGKQKCSRLCGTPLAFSLSSVHYSRMTEVELPVLA